MNEIFNREWELFLEQIPDGYTPCFAHASLCGVCTIYAKELGVKQGDIHFYRIHLYNVDLAMEAERFFDEKIAEFREVK